MREPLFPFFAGSGSVSRLLCLSVCTISGLDARAPDL